MMSPHLAMPRPFTRLPPADDASFSRLVESIDPEWIEEALAATGTATVRRRRLPAEQVLWLVLGMALYRKCAIDELAERLNLVLPGKNGSAIARSAVVKARARLGDEPLEWLFNCCSHKWGHESAREHGWRGLAIYGADGTTHRTPDSPENREYFGCQDAGAGRGFGGYPLVRIVTLMALRSHIIVAANFGPYSGSEQDYAKPLWEQVPADSVVIVDRNFFDAKILIPLARDQRNRHWLIRARANNSWRVIKKLGKGDELVEMEVNKYARRIDETLPRTWMVRAIRYQRRGFQPQILLTSMLDSKAYPAKEIIALYHERWEVELAYDEVKTELLEREEALRSKSPKGVAQELWAIGLVYNLIRLEMERIADEADVPPNRISFIAALHLIQDEWKYLSVTNSPGKISHHLRELRERLKRYILPPRRSQRAYPRAVKLKVSPYNRNRPLVSRAPAK